LRLDKDGFLRRCDDRQALEQLLLGIMARSPHAKWAGSRHFGLRDFLEDARARPERLQEAVQELNLAFADLGIALRAKSITFLAGSVPGTGTVNFALAQGEGGDDLLEFRVEA
jgi:hypothetical protein